MKQIPSEIEYCIITQTKTKKYIFIRLNSIAKKYSRASLIDQDSRPTKVKEAFHENVKMLLGCGSKHV